MNIWFWPTLRTCIHRQQGRASRRHLDCCGIHTLCCTYPHTHSRTCTHTNIHPCTCVPTHTYTNTHIQTHTNTHIQTNKHTHTHKHKYTQTHTYTHIYTHTHTYTRVPAQAADSKVPSSLLGPCMQAVAIGANDKSGEVRGSAAELVTGLLQV